MTKTTCSRQLRETIGAVLRAHEVDNLQLELDLASAVQKFHAEIKTGRDPVKVREEIAKAIWNGIEKEQPVQIMRQRIMSALQINISDNSSWDGVVSFCLRKLEQGETIEAYAEYSKNNPYSMPKPFQIAQTPGLLRDTWPQAFAALAASEYKEL